MTPVNRLVLLALLHFILPLPRASAAEDELLAFTHATVIDATGAAPQTDATVVVRGNRISAIGRSEDLQPPAEARVVDATGKFLIPGLWDMHVHWHDQNYLPLFIANGVTGVRIMWGMPLHHEWRKGIEQRSLLGPRMFIASPIVDGPKPLWAGSVAVANEEEGRQAVRKAKQDGADFIKVYSVLPRDAYFGIADEAKVQGIPFAGHVPNAVSVEEASRAGQSSIEHLTGILSACSSQEAALLKTAQDDLSALLATNQPIGTIAAKMRKGNRLALQTYDSARAAALFDELRKNHTWQCPTLVVLRNIAFLEDPAITDDPRLRYMPASFRSFWNPGNDPRFKDWTPEDRALAKDIYRKHLEIVGEMERAGVGIIAGTDTSNPYCFPGFSLHDELQLLVKAGLTPMQALQAATRNPARFMGREKESGTIERGKLADLVLLEKNPLEDIGNTRKIAGVVLDGELFLKPALAQLLEKVERLAGRKSASEILFEAFQQEGVIAAIKQYRKLRSSGGYELSEGDLNDLGYQLMASGKIRDAIQILKLNAEEYPQSANVYDSLGEAYMRNGDKELAITNYQKSLERDPGNKNAVEKLRQLSGR
jgi:imidazolonepropionase-like amidohydrolase